MITVNATKRDLGTKARALRRRGLIPAVLYGAHLDPVHVTISEADLSSLFNRITRSTMVELRVNEESYRVFVKDFQVDPITTRFLHLDFYAPESGRTMTMNVPVKVVGAAPGVKAGGILEVLHTEIPVEASPEKIPEFITVDISGLELEEAVLVKDLPWEEGVKPLLPEEDAVVVVLSPKVEVAPAPAAAAPAAEVPAEPGAEEPAAPKAEAPAKKS